MNLEQFAPCVHQTFVLAAGGQALEFELTEAKPLPRRDDQARAPFALLFRGPAAPVLPQRLYALESAALGRLQLFLVPVGRDGPNTDATRPVLYEAVFN